MKLINLCIMLLLPFAALPLQAEEKIPLAAKPASVEKKSTLSIAAIELNTYDRLTGKFVEINNATDPYGLFEDIFVQVKVKNQKFPLENDPWLTIKLTATTEETDDEARGITEATKQVMTSKGVLNYEGEITTFPFLIRHKCNPMTVTAEIPELHLKKTIQIQTGCAE